MKPPAFQFYADDFIGGTITMSHDERGLYILLLCLQWTQGGISQSDFNRLGKGMAQPSLSHVKAKFKLADDGRLKNERLERVRAEQSAFSASRSESGKAGAKKRWHSHSTAIVLPMAKNSSPSPTPIDRENRDVELPNGFPETEEQAKAPAAFVGCPESFAIETWNKAKGRGGRDAKDVPIRSWQHYLKSEFNFQKNRTEKEKAYANPIRSTAKNDRNFGMPTTAAQTSARIVAELKARGGK